MASVQSILSPMMQFSVDSLPMREDESKTLSQALEATVAAHGDKEAFSVSPDEADAKVSLTWKQFYEKAKGFARALVAMEVVPGRVVATQGSNSIELITANVGTILASGVTAGIYPTNSPELSQHAVTSTDAAVVVVENEAQLKKYEGMNKTAAKCFVVWNKNRDALIDASRLQAPVYSWDEFIAKGSEGAEDPDGRLEEKLHRRMQKQKPDDVCTLVMTSGTTGMPKAAQLTHDNLLFTGKVATKVMELSDKERTLSYLPLSHVAAFQSDVILPILNGFSVEVSGNALQGTNLKNKILHLQPTSFLGVARVWEKFVGGIQEKIRSVGTLQRLFFRLVTWITRQAVQDLQSLDQRPFRLGLMNTIFRLYNRALIAIMEALLLNRVKSAMGLGQCRKFVCGASALKKEASLFLLGLNIRVQELYGMSETSGPAVMASQSAPLGSCGKPLPGTTAVIMNPDENGDGEIGLKGRHIFRGYLNNKDETKKSFTKDGFLRTGDIGRFDANGNLFITGRIKELMKTSGGENIPFLEIENKIKQALPDLVSELVLVGNNRNFLSALIALPTKGDSAQQLTEGAIAKLREIGSSATTLQEASEDPKVQEAILKIIQKEVNQKAQSGAQKVAKIAIVAEPFSVQNGTVTPTQKLKRAFIYEKYRALIDTMYAE